MQSLLTFARARNRAVGVTGMLVYERGRFYQWLEGPSKGLAEVWRSIRNDPRHREIELLSEESSPARVFGAWDMHWLRRPAALDDTRKPMDQAAQRRHIRTLARLALDGNGTAIADLIASLLAPGEDIKALYGSLFEPALRLLGDWWREDLCGDFDVTFALGVLQTTTRRLVNAALWKLDVIGRDILIAPHPCESHILGAIMASDVFRHARWNVAVEFPRSDGELIDIVRATSFHVLNLSLSDVYCREHRLADMAATIRALRNASRNPRIVIVVGGRAFMEHTQVAAAMVGADMAYASCVDAVDQTGLALCRSIANIADKAGAKSSRAKTPSLMTLSQNLPLGWHLVPAPVATPARGRSAADPDRPKDGARRH